MMRESQPKTKKKKSNILEGYSNCLYVTYKANNLFVK